MSLGWIRGAGAVVVAVGLSGLAASAAEAKVLDIDKFKVSVAGSQESSFTYTYTDPESGASCAGSGTERVEFSTPSALKVRAALVKYRGTKRALWSFGKIARSGLGDPNFELVGRVTRQVRFQGSYSEDSGTCNFDGTPVDCAVTDAPVTWELALLGGASSIGTDESVILAGPARDDEKRAGPDVACKWPAELNLFAYPQFGGTVSGFFIDSERRLSADSIKRVFKDSVDRVTADGTYTLSGAPPTTYGEDSGQAAGEWHLDFERTGKPDKPR